MNRLYTLGFMRSTPTVRGPLPTKALSRLAALLCALLISACSNNPYPAAFREKRDDGSPWQVRYMAMPEDPRSLDPQVSYDNVSRRVLEPLQECLLEYHPFKTDPYQLSPCLLQSMPERIEREGGGVIYKCALKEGILFQDDPCFPNGAGRELVGGAADRVAALMEQRLRAALERELARCTLAELLYDLRSVSAELSDEGGLLLG
jgi:hypothetical protein